MYNYNWCICGIRISSNCVELIFVKVHLSTLGASRDAVFSILLSAKRFNPGGLRHFVSRRSQSRKMNLYKDGVYVLCNFTN